MENVILFPPLGSASVYTRDRMDQLVVDNIAAWAAGKPPLTPVPETPFSWDSMFQTLRHRFPAGRGTTSTFTLWELAPPRLL